jgi:CBS domain
MDHPLRRPEEILAFRTLEKILEGRPRILWSVRPTDTVQAAQQTMAEKRIGFLVVLDQGALAGIISERDVVGRAVLAKKPLEPLWGSVAMPPLAGHAGGQVPARQPGSGELRVIEDAPGSYVSVRFHERDVVQVELCRNLNGQDLKSRTESIL